jgi:DNA polymerase II small subunit/DNA polymerase delta subunit B
MINNTLTNDPLEIAEEFNNFFSNIGSTISNTVNPTTLEADDFVPPNPNPPSLDFSATSPSL